MIDSEPVVARVAEVWRYPVKSMAGERLTVAEVSWQGVAGDRRWAFVRPGRLHSGFPWLTIRQQPRLNHYRPTLVEPDRPDRSAVQVQDPEGRVYAVDDPALAGQFGDGVWAIKHDRGTFDASPVSLLTRQTLDALSGRVGADVDARRFRANLILDAPGPDDFPEDGWVGRMLRIGTAVVRVDQPAERCAMVNVDPDSLARNSNVLRTIAQQRALDFAVYGSTVTPGTVRRGDPVVLLG
ncbi:MAG TPA: MOSC N-terminal beta barrel domain-containing protein [Propionibacteriaceae bacterium]|nr:MOSC N-terminal beta barrel domain-containing protein [Propionibacteriaceae bacterium]